MRQTRATRCSRRARAETVGWLEREMLVEDAFASSLDADSEGEEGKYYVWQAAEIDRLLGRGCGRLPARLRRHRRRQLGGQDGAQPPAPAGRCWRRTRRRRCAPAPTGCSPCARERVPPGRDDKVLADWNGLMIARSPGRARCSTAGLARAGASAPSPSSRPRCMTDDRLAHSWRARPHARSRLPRGLRPDGRARRSPCSSTPRERAYLDQAERWIRRPRRRLSRPRARRLFPGAGRGDRRPGAGQERAGRPDAEPATARCSRCSRGSST